MMKNKGELTGIANLIRSNPKDLIHFRVTQKRIFKKSKVAQLHNYLTYMIQVKHSKWQSPEFCQKKKLDFLWPEYWENYFNSQAKTQQKLDFWCNTKQICQSLDRQKVMLMELVKDFPSQKTCKAQTHFYSDDKLGILFPFQV